MSLPASITPALLTQLTGMVATTTGRTVPVVEVYTGDPIVDLPQSSPEDVASAYAEAREAQATWASWPL
jgi:acyl-CoA reductase-like NAD-dependent aldehyde dehydrogenase